ncbi:FRG domain-containing protein [Paraburkholderia denitrificans]|uniref:FRG domain-containing protein n=1 Tax=Paraburkholderia denitrificans TaxID=694025 RepID=A0ABW0J3E4_9BURK
MHKKRYAKHLGDARNLAEFLAAINGKLNGEVRTLYRGQSDAGWSLKPAIARLGRSVSLREETSMLEEFKRRAIPYLDSPLSDIGDADWLAIAQHHGMPTRMLDWSGSALTALWFAIKQPAETQTAAAVWILTYEPEDLMRDAERNSPPLAIARTVVIRPRHITRRITAQDGWFTLHRNHDGNRKSPEFVSLETNRDYKNRLYYVTIPASAFGEMRVQLAKAGVNPSVLFPDLGGVADFVKWSHQYPKDELQTRVEPLL